MNVFTSTSRSVSPLSLRDQRQISPSIQPKSPIVATPKSIEKPTTPTVKSPEKVSSLSKPETPENVMSPSSRSQSPENVASNKPRSPEKTSKSKSSTPDLHVDAPRSPTKYELQSTPLIEITPESPTEKTEMPTKDIKDIKTPVKVAFVDETKVSKQQEPTSSTSAAAEGKDAAICRPVPSERSSEQGMLPPQPSSKPKPPAVQPKVI